jgi:uncharacterized protein (TIGR03435 family)
LNEHSTTYSTAFLSKSLIIRSGKSISDTLIPIAPVFRVFVVNRYAVAELIDRPVLDRTGLSGRFDFTIQWSPESNGQSTAETQVQVDSEATTFLETLKEQLGLRLKPERAPLDVLIIDHLELPSEN